MSNQPKNPSRRKLVKKISVSGGVTLTAASLPGTWVQPLVESTILPTHAMTSVSFFGSDLSGIVSSGEDDWYEGLVDTLVPQAHAQDTPRGHSACANVVGDSVSITFQNQSNAVRRTGTLPANGDPGSLTISELSMNCKGVPCNSLDANIDGITDVVTLRIQRCRPIQSDEDIEPQELIIPREDIVIEIPMASACELPPLTGSCNEG